MFQQVRTFDHPDDDYNCGLCLAHYVEPGIFDPEVKMAGGTLCLNQVQVQAATAIVVNN